MKAYCRKCEPDEELKSPSQFSVIDWLAEIEKEKELSFKAGIKEVVEWIEENNTKGFPHHAWQAQLKEWGIKT